MAAAKVLPSPRIMPGSSHLARVSFPEAAVDSQEPPDPKAIATKWAAALTDLIEAGKTDVSSIFHKDAYWRDLLCQSWDLRTLYRPEGIGSFIKSQPGGWRIKKISIDDSTKFRSPQMSAVDPAGSVKCVQSFVSIETDVGKGHGVVRLILDSDKTWKSYIFFTALEELADHPESTYTRRPQGVREGVHPARGNWKDERSREENLEDEGEPAVVIVGLYLKV